LKFNAWEDCTKWGATAMVGSPSQFLALGETQWRVVPSGWEVRWREWKGAHGRKIFTDRRESWEFFDRVVARLHAEWWKVDRWLEVVGR
jgi:hypothetical protein